MKIKVRLFICILLVLLFSNSWTLCAKEEINVKSFGALGNGIANDAAAIQQAIDYAYSNNGGTVLIPAGIYNINSLIILKKGVSLYGDNATFKACKTGSILTCKGSNNVSGIKIVGTLNKSSSEITKSIWQNRYKEGQDVLVSVFSADDVVFENCTIQNNICEGIKSSNCRNIKIKKCTFLNLDCGYIAQGNYAEDIEIEGCTFNGYSYSEPISIYCVTAKRISIVNNNISNKQNGIGILVGKSTDNYYSDITINGNIITNCSVGIQLVSVTNAKVSENRMSQLHHGMTITKSKTIWLEKNKISNTSFHGINIDNSSDVYLKSNEFEKINFQNTNANVTIPCIYVKNSDHVSISESIFKTTEKNKYALNLQGNIDNLIYISNNKTMLIYITNATKITNSQIVTSQGILGNFNPSIIDKSTFIYQYGVDNITNKYNYKFLN